jgi:hypothetical protein
LTLHFLSLFEKFSETGHNDEYLDGDELK